MKKHSLLLSFFLLFALLGCESPSPTANGKKVVEIRKTYFTGGKVSSELHMTDHTGHNGTLKKYGYNGNVTSIVTLHNGIKHGQEIWFDPNGLPIRKIPYINGHVHGSLTELYPNGDVMVSYTYIKGTKEGPARTFNTDGSIHKEVMFSGNRIIN